MGLSPLAGVPMGTRAGDIDTCVAQFIMNKYNMSADDCLTMLNKKSGVLALSDEYRGTTPDIRTCFLSVVHWNNEVVRLLRSRIS